MLLREAVELAMVRTMRQPAIESIPLYEEALVLVVPPGHPFAERSKVGIADVASERLIFFDRTSSYYELTQSFFLSLGVTPREVMELDNIESAKKMVERRLGIAWLPRTAVAAELAAKTLTHVAVPCGVPRAKRDEDELDAHFAQLGERHRLRVVEPFERRSPVEGETRIRKALLDLLGEGLDGAAVSRRELAPEQVGNAAVQVVQS